MNGYTFPPERLKDWTVKQRLQSVLETLAECPSYRERDAARVAVMNADEACAALTQRMADSLALDKRLAQFAEDDYSDLKATQEDARQVGLQ